MITFVVILLFIIIGKKTGIISKKGIIRVSTEMVLKRDIVETVSASGKIYPQSEVKISSDVSGEVIELNVKEGDSVVQGMLLLKIDPDVYLAMVDRMEATVNTQKANLANTKARYIQFVAQFTRDSLEYNRNKQLFDKGVISQSEYENYELAYKSSHANLEAASQSVNAARFSVLSSQASLNEARKNLKKTTLFAPVSGIVSKLNIEQGERVVGTSQMSGTELLRIANLNKMEVRVDVSENDIIRVNVMDTVAIEVDAYLDRDFKGVVTEIASSANNTNIANSDQVTNFTVKIELLRESYEDLIVHTVPQKYPFFPGMSASVEIQTDKILNIISVPIQSVTIRDEENSEDNDESERDNKTKKSDDNSKEVVFIYSKNAVTLVEVTTGIQDDTYIQIIEGLTEEDEIIIAPYSAISKKLNDGDAVEKVKKEKLYTDAK